MQKGSPLLHILLGGKNIGEGVWAPRVRAGLKKSSVEQTCSKKENWGRS